MTTINTIEDLVRLLDERPEWVEALRVRLLTRELLELPVAFAKLSETFAKFAETFAEFVETTNNRLTLLETDVSQLKNDVGHLKGWALESRLHSRIVPLISQKLGLRRAELLRTPAYEMQAALKGPVEDSADNGLISDEQELRLVNTDFILRGRHRETLHTVWVAVEVSNKVRTSDITRALESSRILTAIFEEACIPVVSGYAIDPPDQQQANAHGVVYIEVDEDWT